MKLNLPPFDESNVKSFIVEVNDLISSGQFDGLVEGLLDQHVDKGNIKRYKRINTYYKKDPVSKIGIGDFKSDILVNLYGFEIAVHHESQVRPILVTGYNKIISVNPPWRIEILKIQVKELKTQTNIRMNFALFLSLSDYEISPPEHDNCNHDFKLFFNGIWNWCLVWECIYCGLICHCKCFERVTNAVKDGKIITKRVREFNGSQREFVRVARVNRAGQIRSIEAEKGVKVRDLGIDLDNLPFYENTCEVCRNVPSNHKYCHKMYARSEFEIRYGAYIKKKFYELKLDENLNSNSDEELERIANNITREELGFKKIGQRFVTETELYRIIKSIFPDKKVKHHYRPSWLEGQELDIFIPELKLAVEYDGIQHFKPINAWGGEEGLRKTQHRDKIKETKCIKENITLIRFSYKEKEFLSKNYVKNKIISKI